LARDPLDADKEGAVEVGAVNGPEWRTRRALEHHFGLHGHDLGAATVEDYDRSARETIVVGTYFEYRDLTTEEWRVGYYDVPTERFTVLSDDEQEIITHFRCPEGYVRDLWTSTYA
jgi:hypothetical protein